MGEWGRGKFCSYTGKRLGYDSQILLSPFLLDCSAVPVCCVPGKRLVRSSSKIKNAFNVSFPFTVYKNHSV